MHRVMIQPAGYDTCRNAVDLAFELFPLRIAKKKVLIKPNVLRASEAKEHIVTNPALLRAVVGMEGNGPASPELRDIGLILASDNAVALDGVIATMMGLDPARLQFLQKAKSMGLGDYDTSKIQIHGELKVLPGFKLPPLGGEAIAGNTIIQDFINSKTRVRPLADPDLCTACGACVKQCPVSALTMKKDIPEADADICITCFCCQEICPEKAMSLR